jgi:hypothetical protein
MSDEQLKLLERAACTPEPVEASGFNPSVRLPFGLSTEHIRLAMIDFTGFLGFVNQQLNTKEMERLESIVMPANFSSIVGEFMGARIPKHCPTIVKNQYHNGHPDLIPAKVFPNNAVQHATEGIEIKASRYLRGWQGHNPEDAWLMVFVFDSNRPIDYLTSPKPFRFVMVVGAQLTKEDWMFSGRSETSRRTITASVKRSGYEKMMATWIYKAPALTRAGTVDLLQPPGPQPLEPPDEE